MHSTEGNAWTPDPGLAPVTDRDFCRFRKIMERHAGIRLGNTKRPLVYGRLASRMRELGLTRFSDYLDRVEADPRGAELQTLIDRLTTNETFFFREPRHFDLLRAELRAGRWSQRPVRVWSAACSSGEEPYTIAMVLADELGLSDWGVLGSDISTRVLAAAERGVYREDRAKGIPPEAMKRYCLKGVRSQQGYFAVAPELRSHVAFRRINLDQPLPEVGDFDLIFVRNVMIYFDARVKRRVVQRLLTRLRPGGYLFVGHSETLNGLADGLACVQPTVYCKSS